MDCSHIILSFYNSAQKINFNVSKIKKIEKVRSTYGIPDDETIVAYIKSTVFFITLAMDGLIITNQAVYAHPNRQEDAEPSRFPFSEICKYYVHFGDEKAPVTLNDATHSYQLVKKTFFGENKGGQELIDMLLQIQLFLLTNFDFAQEQHISLCFDVIQSASIDIEQSNPLSPHQIKLLEHVCDWEQFREKAISLLARNMLLNQDFLAFDAYVTEHAAQISEECHAELLSFFQVEIDALEQKARDIHNLDSLSESEIAKVSDFFYQKTNLPTCPEQYKWIFAYLLARKTTSDSRDTFLAFCNRNHLHQNQTRYLQLMFFECHFRTHWMRRLWIKTQQGDLPSHVSYDLFYRDCLGLDVLHYYILSGEFDIGEALIKRHPEISFDTVTRAPKSPDAWEVTENIFNYAILAAQFSPYLLEFIFHRFNSMVQGLDEFKTLALHEMSDLKRELRDLTRDPDTLPFQIENLEYKIREQEFSLQTYESELYFLISNLTDEAQASAQKLYAQCDHPFLGPFFRGKGRSQIELLEQILETTPNNSDLYFYDGQYFILPKGFSIDIQPLQVPSYDYDEKEYGTSWFSSKAHLNIDALKHEYRVLAMKYHPDINNAANSKLLFQSILDEKSLIEQQLINGQR